MGIFQPAMSTLPETNSLHLKMDGWNSSFLLGCHLFRGELLVSGSVYTLGCPPAQDSSHHQDDIMFLGDPNLLNLHLPLLLRGDRPIYILKDFFNRRNILEIPKTGLTFCHIGLSTTLSLVFCYHFDESLEAKIPDGYG